MTWQTKKLEVLCDVFADGDWIEKKDQSQEGIRLIQTGNIGSGYFKDRGEKARYISEKTFHRLNCTEILPDDCLVSRLPDPVGRACIIPETGEKMITAVDCTIIRFKNETLPRWFVNYSLSHEYQNQINKEVGGSTRQRISRANLGQIEIPLPTLTEQKRIVKKLDEVFEKVATAKENAEKNLRNSKELFESYLQSVFANPGKDWEEKKIKEIGITQTGLTPKTAIKKYYGNFVPFITPADIDISGDGSLQSANKYTNSI
ncbi:MAG: Type I restriction-modification system RcaSBIV, S subunit [Candidatus Amesbacteria bacterium GW2011_GWA2_42_12]|uniref:Type I restriction-modification system RcaSBIV, S subunit n=1 Tax=Candidatus Amesbacteria bacterium GW2011_GWA2_42_12 TaxID=1618356 RepID=A0A0G0Y1U1_9BACT|nr:MAG: Type I restriction-modification system RcaSBIV, S subunit [Candidatus Amesbacteria bacterium GW2011_GWA2_42_12]